MEFPDLGKHCSEKTCKQLDFLPLECDACKQDFCKDHFTYAAHKCPFAFKKDVQVPVCPLCNSPVPVKKDEIPDVVVGAHMDGGCKRHPGRKKEEVLGGKGLGCLAVGGFTRGAGRLAGSALQVESKVTM
ncbi:AN1-type zinc finger protein 2A isoform X4 [Balaenoptera musculus]|uniref:AN1-type zinc finger protein 2A isoform X4 n=1 Tax=Balaenoptera musculus TaxID=9771 RepID=A0A8B8VBF1_BALMU|nr:AN1-type zinc finger protein 2A isoform X4 [Balaenoptera musculus]